MHLNSCCDRLWNASTDARRDPCQAPCAVVNRALGLLGLNPQRALWAALPWADFLRRIVGGASVFPNATMRSVEENKCNALGEATATISACASNQPSASREARQASQNDDTIHPPRRRAA